MTSGRTSTGDPQADQWRSATITRVTHDSNNHVWIALQGYREMLSVAPTPASKALRAGMDVRICVTTAAFANNPLTDHPRAIAVDDEILRYETDAQFRYNHDPVFVPVRRWEWQRKRWIETDKDEVDARITKLRSPLGEVIRRRMNNNGGIYGQLYREHRLLDDLLVFEVMSGIAQYLDKHHTFIGNARDIAKHARETGCLTSNLADADCETYVRKARALRQGRIDLTDPPIEDLQRPL